MGNNVQKYVFDLHAWVIDLTECGRFKGQPSARTVLDFYCQSASANEGKGRLIGYVLPGCVAPATVAKKTGVTDTSVRNANKWLEAEGLISITYSRGKKNEYPRFIYLESK